MTTLFQLTLLLFLSVTLAAHAQTAASGSYLLEHDVTSVNPQDIFIRPDYLNDLWLDEPLPLSYYKDDDITVQKKINAQVTDAIVTYSPVNRNSEWLDIDSQEITPYTWKWVDLKLNEWDGSVTEMQLRRPNWWIKKHGIDSVGKSAFMHLDELNAHGWATVTGIRPNQLDSRLSIEHRTGDFIARPIIGKFLHESNNVYDLYFDEEDNPMSVTGSHLIWSVDRDDWISAAELSIREEVMVHVGKTRLLCREKKEGAHKVYNIEVYRSHNYYASRNTVLVHNGPICGIKLDGEYWTNLTVRALSKPKVALTANFEAQYIGEKVGDQYNLVLYYIERKGSNHAQGQFTDALESLFNQAKASGAKELNFTVRVIKNFKVEFYLENIIPHKFGGLTTQMRGKDFVATGNLDEIVRKRK